VLSSTRKAFNAAFNCAGEIVAIVLFGLWTV
jgi:hypothetical protein